MTGLGWQDVVAIGLAVLAAGWLGWRRFHRARRPTPLCGDCPGCEPAQDPRPALGGPVIPVSELTRRD